MLTPDRLGWGNPYALTSADMVLCDIGQGRYVRLRNRDVGTLVAELVRRLRAAGWTGPNPGGSQLDDWGYNGRLKRWAQAAGQQWGTAPMSSVSDHAWGTGVDLDTLANPMLVRRPADPWAHCNLPRQTANIAASLGFDWGGLWQEPWDPQHFGLTISPRQTSLLAQKIRATTGAGDDTDDTLEQIMNLYPDAAAYEAGVARATAAGVNAALGAWLPRAVAAASGRRNSFFPDADVNDDDTEAILAQAEQSNALLEGILLRLPAPTAPPEG